MGRIIAVGDRNQCQPKGTLVRTPSGAVSIESLKDGDLVVSVDTTHSCFKASGEKIRVAKRNYLGRLVEVYSAGKHSAYTPNHRCIAQPKPLCRKYAVYLMRKGDNFRLGSTQFGVRGGSGIRTRMMSEDADALWVLTMHETKADACFQEAMLATVHGIPERTFISQTADGSRNGLNQPLLDRLWAAIPHQGAKALNLLTLFGRDIEHPLVSRSTAHAFRARRPSEIHASNLLVGMLVLHDSEKIHYRKHQWKPIDQILSYNFDGPVYSLDVAGTHAYIADGIATHNSIYGFRGAHSGAMDELRDRFGMLELPLSISYRCPRAVVQKAKTWVPQIESHEAAIDGYVGESGTDWAGQVLIALGATTGESLCHCGIPLDRHNPMDDGHVFVPAPVEPWPEGISKWQELKHFAPGDVIICRLTRPLVALAFALIRARIPARVLGRDIGQGLSELVRRVLKIARAEAGMALPAFEGELGRYLDAQRAKLTARAKKAELGRLEDQAATLRVFMDGMEESHGSRTGADDVADLAGLKGATVADLITDIERFFIDNGQGGVVLSTVHKAKGLEWDRVFVLDAHELMPWKWASQEWELEQERHLMYVACTRAKRELRYVTSEELGVGGDF